MVAESQLPRHIRPVVIPRLTRGSGNANRRRITNRAALRSLITVLALSGSTSALAQAGPADGEASGDDEIVVSGSIVQSQIASIEAKRSALNFVDVAAADSVGRFPDQNSAAALSRLPAVAVQRDQGQERYIQIRGAPNRWTSVMIDGVPMVGVDEGGDTRAFRFDAIPAVLLSEIAINKSLTPALQADAIVAGIDLKTYSPMARQGLHINGDLGYGFINLGKGEQRQGSLRLSWANDSFGVVIGGSHYRRKQLTDNREVGLFDEPSNAADATFGPTEIDIRQYEIERWNNGLFAGLEFQPSDGLRLWLKGIFTEFNDDEQRNQWELRLDRAVSGVRNLASGDLVGVPMRGSFNYGEYRNRNTIGTFGADYESDDGLSIDLRLNYARTDNNTYLPLVQASTSGLASPSLTYDRSDPRFPIVTLYQTVAGATAGSVVRGPLASGFNQTSLNPAGAILIDARQKNRVRQLYRQDRRREGIRDLQAYLWRILRRPEDRRKQFFLRQRRRHRRARNQRRHAVQRQQLHHVHAVGHRLPAGLHPELCRQPRHAPRYRQIAARTCECRAVQSRRQHPGLPIATARAKSYFPAM